MSSVLDRLATRADEAERQAARLRKMVELAKELGDDGLAELVALLNDDDGIQATVAAQAPRPHVVRDVPRGRDAIRIIVRERPGPWSLAELRAEMEARGWFTTQKGLEAAAKRLCEINGEGRRTGYGQYVFPADYGEEGASESHASGGALIPFAQ